MNILYVEKNCYSNQLAKDLFLLSEHKLVFCDTVECAKNVIKNDCNIGVIILDLKSPLANVKNLLSYMEDKMSSIPVIVIEPTEQTKSSQFYSRRNLVKIVHENTIKLPAILKSITKFGLTK